MNLDELDPDSPEYEAAIEAAQAEEDAARGQDEGAADENDESTPEGEAQEAVADEGKSADEEPQPVKVAGVASKDGSRVLPYSALKAERRAARHERNERERIEAELTAARKQIEDLKAGVTPDGDELSEEELADISVDFPKLAKVHERFKAAQAELAELKKGKAQPESDDDPVQDAIDTVPLLADWQATDAEKFARAKAIDAALQGSRKWAGRDLAERFAYVAKQVADEYDIQIEEEPQSKPKPNRADPKDVIDKAKRHAPNTLSDFKGGAADPQAERLERLPAAKAVARMSAMSDEEIDAHLAKFG